MNYGSSANLCVFAALITISLSWSISAASASDCDAEGSIDAKAIPFAVADAASAQALTSSIVMGASRGLVFLHTHGLQLNNPTCAIATFSIGTFHYVINGNDDGVWPRIADGGDAPKAFLFATLKPETALKSQRVWNMFVASGATTLVHVPRSDLIYVLAGNGWTTGHLWPIYGFFDKIPDTPRLAQIMCQAVLGSLPVVALYDPSSKTVELKDVAAMTALGDVGKSGGPCTVGPPPIGNH